MLELIHLEKYYNQGTVNEMCLFEDFNLTIRQGEFVSVVGSNGSGKSTLLNLICGTIPLDAGRILVNGTDITNMPDFKRQRIIGRVYQNPAMGTCPNMTILENMAIADTKGKPFNLRRGTSKKRIGLYRELLSALVIMNLTDQIVREKKLTAIMVTHNLRYAVEYGNRLLMMHQGQCVIDRAGKEKEGLRPEDLLEQFNAISIECGN